MNQVPNTPDPTAQDNPLAEVSSVQTSLPIPEAAPAKPTPKKQVRRIGAGFYVGCIGFIVFLFVILVSLLVWLGGVDPTLFEAFGIPTEQVPRILSGLVNTTFGLLTLIIFVGLLGSVLQLALLKKSDKDRRKPLIYGIIFAGACLLLLLPAWFIVASSIRITIPVSVDTTIIQVSQRNEGGQFEPVTNLNNLQGPIELRFSAAAAENQYPGYRVLNYEWDVNGDGLFLEGVSGQEVAWRYEDKGPRNGLFDITVRMTLEALPGNPTTPAGQRREATSVVPITIASVRPTPVVRLNPISGQGPAPLTVQFDARESFDGDSSSLEFYWNFAEDRDGLYNDARGAQVSHTYTEPGEYAASLRVEDLEGNFTIADIPIVVEVPGSTEPVARAIVSPTSGQAPLRITVNGTDSTSPNGAITRYLWDFGDGTLEQGAILNHTYTRGGSYTLRLRVTDRTGQEADTTVTIDVEGETFAPRLSVRTTPPMQYDQIAREHIITGGVPLQVEFDASSTTDPDQDIIAYEWDFDGDGVFDATGVRSSHNFTRGGDSVVRVRVRDAAGNSDEMTIRVRQDQQQLEARMQVAPISGSTPLRVNFDASPSRYVGGSIEAYQWDFGDGTNPRIAGAQVTYTYQSVGTYTARLTVLTNDGKEASTTQRIIVLPVPLSAQFSPSVRAGNAPLSVDFSTNDSTGAIEQYLWDFGDGITSTQRNPSHTFTRAGTYEVRLRVIDRDNVEDEYLERITVF